MEQNVINTLLEGDIDQILDLPLTNLLLTANMVRREYIGDRLDLCSIINAKSGLCREDCKFCAQSVRHVTAVKQYPLVSENALVAAAQEAKSNGAGRFGIVTSGNKLTAKELDVIVRAISTIKKEVGITICASLGALAKDELCVLRDAGLSRYHHNIETSPVFYSSIVTTHSFQERLDTIAAAKEAELEVCSGGIIGMGESWQDRIDMVRLLKNMEVDAVPLNILVPIKGTPLENLKAISCIDVVRTISIFRIILGDKTIKIAAGRETCLKDFQGLAFMAGANGMIIGGYLTVRGRAVDEDHKLINEIKQLWNQ